MDYEKRHREIVSECAAAGAKTAQDSASRGVFEPLYLYFQKSSEVEDGALTLVPDSKQAPEGFELATGEGLRGNVPFEHYFSWVRARSVRLPILSWGL